MANSKRERSSTPGYPGGSGVADRQLPKRKTGRETRRPQVARGRTGRDGVIRAPKAGPAFEVYLDRGLSSRPSTDGIGRKFRDRLSDRGGPVLRLRSIWTGA